MIDEKPKVWPVTYVFKQIRRTLLWCDDGTNQIFKKDDKHQLLFIKDEDGLNQWQEQFELMLAERIVYDIDEYFTLIANIPANKLIMQDSCTFLLKLCNFFDDLALTLNIYSKLELFNSRRQYLIYNKIYCGNDKELFKDTPEGYHPSFNLTKIKKLLEAASRV